MNKPYCPKCKSNYVIITEVWESYLQFTFDDSGCIDEDNKGCVVEGAPFKVKGQCEICNHTWTFKNLSQIKQEWFE